MAACQLMAAMAPVLYSAFTFSDHISQQEADLHCLWRHFCVQEPTTGKKGNKKAAAAVVAAAEVAAFKETWQADGGGSGKKKKAKTVVF